MCNNYKIYIDFMILFYIISVYYIWYLWKIKINWYSNKKEDKFYNI